jgi:hypothetical protein
MVCGPIAPRLGIRKRLADKSTATFRDNSLLTNMTSGEKHEFGWAYLRFGCGKGGPIGANTFNQPYAGFHNIRRASFLFGWIDSVQHSLTDFKNEWLREVGEEVQPGGRVRILE